MTSYITTDLRTRLTRRLLRERTDQGGWDGRLSSSALATAVAAFALQQVDPQGYRVVIDRALTWLIEHANADGGWGDTPQSRSHPSTTLLCRAALTVADPAEPAVRAARAAADTWIERHAGSMEPDALVAMVSTLYGDDRTFSTPILVMSALAGLLGAGADGWRRVPPLPFELAALPPACYRLVGLPIVSYAMPALIAMGLAVHRRRCGGGRFPGRRRVRDALTPAVLNRLTRLQPLSGGFLEAAPLTGFVALSLCAAGERQHPVVERAAGFLAATVRADGSWPIDTNLKTWVTTLAVQALSVAPGNPIAALYRAERLDAVHDWLLRTQHRQPHPYTGAAPGGWAWTDLSGGVPDADDTAGALIALHHLAKAAGGAAPADRAAAERGVRWLLDLQNRDGGLPTFCRGWGRLPFDRSCPDLTAHAVAAWTAWADSGSAGLRRRAQRGLQRAIRYLERTQQPDGSWIPLWFGNEHAPGAENRTYGTARTIVALSRLNAAQGGARVATMVAAGIGWLQRQRNQDGGWGACRGTPSSIEETALATQALAGCPTVPDVIPQGGLAWIERRLKETDDAVPTPIGLYFASLWYGERLYPWIFALGAAAAVEVRENHRQNDPPSDPPPVSQRIQRLSLMTPCKGDG